MGIDEIASIIDVGKITLDELRIITLRGPETARVYTAFPFRMDNFSVPPDAATLVFNYVISPNENVGFLMARDSKKVNVKGSFGDGSGLGGVGRYSIDALLEIELKYMKQTREIPEIIPFKGL